MLYTKRIELLKARQEGRVITTQPRGLMDKAPAYGAGDCGFKSRRGWYFYYFCIIIPYKIIKMKT